MLPLRLHPPHHVRLLPQESPNNTKSDPIVDGCHNGRCCVVRREDGAARRTSHILPNEVRCGMASTPRAFGARRVLASRSRAVLQIAAREQSTCESLNT